MKLRSVGILAGLGGLLLSGNAMAQDPAAPAPAPAAEPAPALPPPSEPAAAPAQPAQAGGQAQVGMALPGAAPAAEAAPGNTDHDAVIGRLAVGYLGLRTMLISTSPIANAQAQIPFEAPIVGVRYWIDQMLGLDLGVGLSISGGSTEQSPVIPPAPSTLDLQGYTVFMAHAGVPLALASGKHYSFQIIPEVNLGIANSSIEVMGFETRFSGFHLDIGMRAGAEVQFGFIGIPELGLQAGVGLGFQMDTTNGTADATVGTPETSFDVSTNRFATSVGDNPWNIFTSNVAALYYF
jgi:hypothetical protein